MNTTKDAPSEKNITLNKKAFHDYKIEEKFVCGLVLSGWEVKSLRAGRVQIVDSHVIIRNGEAWLLGTQITPLLTASTHEIAEPARTRKLLLHRKEINKMIGLVDRQGYTIIPLKLFWHRGYVKCELGLARGKKQYDKRQDLKARDWAREKARVLKRN